MPLQVLEANAARLSPEYKQRCRREWGIEGSCFEVSVITPAAHPGDVLDMDDLQSIQSFLDRQCGNSMCGQRAKLMCTACQVDSDVIFVD